ncbi:hypothetical protein R75461_07503 [Paraburkholderia nemoris]|uniref:hypothetical protein n=1 Tax=Paraburkholderia nemoris TaxID=2793076 RepID=UPI00190CC763|nr:MULTISPECIES: hypothetical protein [Paraburkholderia]MBK3786310.1 hypothetical protein [Paraburkholderia aspalathi]CAE6851650.1 hypothetical protein R75461_07503 [Paraburkholderia nemoris]
MTLLQIHAAAVCAWFGLIAAEAVLELREHEPAERRLIASIHAWIDILIEVPLIALVLVTGAMLLARAWPAPPLLMLKVGAGLIAVVANLICVVLVRARVKATDDACVSKLTRQIRFTGLATPFGLAAMIIGFGFLAPH